MGIAEAGLIAGAGVGVALAAKGRRRIRAEVINFILMAGIQWILKRN
jgi:hypothetical protein